MSEGKEGPGRPASPLVAVSFAHDREIGDRDYQEDGYIECPDLRGAGGRAEECLSDEDVRTAAVQLGPARAVRRGGRS